MLAQALRRSPLLQPATMYSSPPRLLFLPVPPAWLPAPAPTACLQVVEGELVSRQMRGLVDMENSGMVPMLQQDKAADLARMYALFRRVDGGVDLLRQVGGLGVGRLRALVGLAAAVD